MPPQRKSWFLIQVYRLDRRLFWLLLIFVAGQSFLIYKGVETVPFFHWGMYSSAYPAKTEYHTTGLAVDDSLIRIDQLKEIPPGYLQSILDRYALLNQQAFHDPILDVIHHRLGSFPAFETFAISRLTDPPNSPQRFEEWLCKYLGRNEGVASGSINLVDCRYAWDSTRFTLINYSVIDSFHCTR